jgi:hypothetical protein
MVNSWSILTNGIDYELRKLHHDVALQANRPALAALFAYVPTSQVLLGSPQEPENRSGAMYGGVPAAKFVLSVF